MNLSKKGKDEDAYRSRRILVTGASGFIGRHLLEALGETGAEVAVVVRDAGCAVSAVQKYVGDVHDASFIKDAMQDWLPNVVFHVAGARARVLGRDAFSETLETNLFGSLNLLFAASEIPSLERVVVLGTAEEYGNNMAPFNEMMRESPISAYSFSKQCASHLAQLMHRSFGLPVVVLRPSVVYGPAQCGDMFLPALIQSLLRGKAFDMTPGEQTRDFVFVEDLVDALLRAGYCKGIDGEIINIGSGEPVVISRLVEYVENLVGCTGLVRRGALNYRIGEPMEYWLDISKAKNMLDWGPQTSLVNGLARTVGWYRDSFA